MSPRVMVVIGQQCSCLHPLVWIGHKLLAQPPRPALGSKTLARAAGKRSAASKRRQAIFTLSDDDAEEGEDADTFRLVPRKRRRQLELIEQGGSSVPVGLASPTTAV